MTFIECVSIDEDDNSEKVSQHCGLQLERVSTGQRQSLIIHFLKFTRCLLPLLYIDKV